MWRLGPGCSRPGLEAGGVGGRLRLLLASGDRPRLALVRALGRGTLKSMGARGEAGEESSERPTGPIGEQLSSLLRCGDCGGRIAELRRSRGVTGERRPVYCFSGACCAVVAVAGGCLVRGLGCSGE